MPEPTVTPYGSQQTFVDSVVHRCIRNGVRTREEIRSNILTLLPLTLFSESFAGYQNSPLKDWTPTDYELHVMISKPTSRKDRHGHRDIWCISKPTRYLSVKRIKYLTARVDNGTILPDELEELKACKADLEILVEHWEKKSKAAHAARHQVVAIQTHVDVAILDLEG